MDKEALNKFFKELRKRGYFAKQNFQCCQTCAHALIPDEKANKFVFYHNQDKEHMDNKGELYLGWAGDGKEIATLAQEAGLRVNWNGSEEQRIQLF